MKLQPSDLRLLRVFVAVAENRGFTTASEALNVGQSTISTHIKRLEERIGFPLCTRGRAGFELTDEGEKVLEAMQKLERQMSDFVASNAEITTNLYGTIRIGVPHVLSRHTFLGGVHELINIISERHKHVEVEIEVVRPADLEKGIEMGTFDLACTDVRIQGKAIGVVELFDMPAHLYCAKLHPLFSIPQKDIDEKLIKEQKSIIFHHNTLLQKPFSIEQSRLTSSSEVSVFYILSGKYIGYLSDVMAQQWVDRGELRAIVPSKYEFNSPGGLVYRRSSLSNPIIQESINIMKTIDWSKIKHP